MKSGWSTNLIGGRPVNIFDFDGTPSPYAILYLGNSGNPIDSPELTALSVSLRKHRLRCVIAHGAESWWTDRICSSFDCDRTAEQYLLTIVVPWIEQNWNIGLRAIAVFGSEMGGQAAIRLGFKYPDRFSVVAGFNSAFDYHERFSESESLQEMYASAEQCRHDTAILHIDPHHWPRAIWFACDPTSEWYRGNDRLHEKLAAIGVPHDADLESTSDGDSVAYLNSMIPEMLERVANGLIQESRRLM